MYYKNKQKPTLPVIPNQVLTMSQMDSLRKEGKPISSFQMSADNFFDGSENPNPEVPLEMQRSIDINQVWEQENETRGKFDRMERRKKIQQQNSIE